MSARVDSLRSLHNLESRHWPLLPCPTCGGLSLVLDRPGVRIIDSGVSKRAQQLEHWEADMVSGSFTGQLRCGVEACQEGVAVLGDGDLVPEMEGRDWYGDYDTRLRPVVFRPPLRIIEPPDQCPETVTRFLEAAADVIWLDPSAAVNRMRAAEEALMTAHSVQRYMVNRKSKRVRLSLHERLERFEKKKPEPAGLLMAVKWLGNDASHGDVITDEDAWEAAEILELALHLLYDDRTAALKVRAAAIVKARGIAKR